jgi:hypothetical protein
MARRTHAGRKARVTSKAALGRYLAAGLGATGLATVESEAAIVNLDITNIGSNNLNISGVNAGIANPGQKIVLDVVNGRGFTVYNNTYTYNGLNYSKVGLSLGFPTLNTINFLVGSGVPNPFRLTQAGTSSVGPTYPAGTVFGPNSAFIRRSLFQSAFASATSPLQAPDWGPGSFIGFRSLVPNSSPEAYNYGYFEVTWSASTSEFQILSGAYESTPNTPIAVPEPSTVALAGIGALALGAGAIRRSRKARKAAAEGTLAEAV